MPDWAPTKANNNAHVHGFLSRRLEPLGECYAFFRGGVRLVSLTASPTPPGLTGAPTPRPSI
jgi:hypothetical protein